MNEVKTAIVEFGYYYAQRTSAQLLAFA